MNEDRIEIREIQSMMLCVIADGHGGCGASDFFSKQMISKVSIILKVIKFSISFFFFSFPSTYLIFER